MGSGRSGKNSGRLRPPIRGLRILDPLNRRETLKPQYFNINQWGKKIPGATRRSEDTTTFSKTGRRVKMYLDAIKMNTVCLLVIFRIGGLNVLLFSHDLPDPK